MEPANPGDLVTVATTGASHDGIVFDVPSPAKVVVAVVDPARGPVFRTFHPRDVAERAEPSPDDRALELLIRRTPPPTAGASRGDAAAQRGRPGHRRASGHRTTGK